MKPQVFISHSSGDGPIIEKLVRLLVLSVTGLDKRDIVCTSEPMTGLSGGAWINFQLMQEIKASACFVAVVSENYLSSRYCNLELGLRLGAGEATTVAAYLPGIIPERLGDVISDLHVLALSDSKSVQRLLEDIASASDHWQAQPDIGDIEGFCALAAQNPANPLVQWQKSLVRLSGGTVFLNCYGLESEPQERPVFQNFHPVGPNIQPVQYLWADPRKGNRIQAKLLTADRPDDSLIRVSFCHFSDSLGCNISIRPLNREALLLRRVSSLTLLARVPEESDLSVVGIGVRLVNGYMQHWESSSAEILSVGSGDFQKVALDFDPRCWALFESDGSGKAGPSHPDFSILASVVLELGGYSHLAPRPTPGEGIIDIREVRIN